MSDTMSHTTSETPRLPAWATPLGCALIVAVLAIPRAVFAARFGLIGDEAYYAIWSFYPGFGYYDHSPAVAWVIWLGRTIFGESEWAVRSMFLVASLVTCAALYRIATLLSSDARIGAAAAIAFSVAPGLLLAFAVATPDGPSTMFWVLTLWAVAEFVHDRNPWWWLAAGALAGLGLLSKYTVVFLLPGLLLYLVASRERWGWLKLWQVWAGAVLSLLMFLPVILIDSTRQWSSFRFQLGRSSLGEHHFAGFGEFARFLLEESIQLLPTLFIFLVIGVALFFARRAKALALPILTGVPMVGYFLIHALFGRVNPNWTAPVFPQLALIGAWAAISVRPPKTVVRGTLTALRALHVPLGVAVLVLAFGVLEFRAVPFIGPVPALGFVYGWDDLQRKVSSLAHEQGAQWVDAGDYSLNGLLGYYGRIAHDPLPVYQTTSTVRSLYRPPIDPALAAAPHLLVINGGNATQPVIDGATPLGAVTRSVSGEDFASYWVYLKP